MSKLETRTRITARVGESTQTLLEEAAAFSGVSINSFVVSAAVEKAGDVLSTERVIRLAQSDAEQIEKIIATPPEPNNALKEAFKSSQSLLDA